MLTLLVSFYSHSVHQKKHHSSSKMKKPTYIDLFKMQYLHVRRILYINMKQQGDAIHSELTLYSRFIIHVHLDLIIYTEDS